MKDELTIEQMKDIANSIAYRQDHFKDESLHLSVKVVLSGCGSRFITVECVNGEWEGVKGDLPGGRGVPRCPNGHVMVETSGGKRLAFVDNPVGGDWR